MKAGTTSIHRYLGAHPQVFATERKELNYFGYEGQRERRFRVKSWGAYRAQFASAADEPAVGEFSPQYMNYPRAAERIAETLPGVRLIASLRSPADRAYSCWAGSVQNGLEREPAEVAIRPGSRYLERGFYSDRLRPFLERFPRERIKLVLFEELHRDPGATMRGIYEFLEVDPAFTPDLTIRHNEARYPRYPRLNRAWQELRRRMASVNPPAWAVRWNRSLLERTHDLPPPFDPELRGRLIALYSDEVGRMEELLERDLSLWRS